jgi:hypothetical protein
MVMNTVTTTLNGGLQTIISKLQKEKDDLYCSYSSAIKNGEKYESIKTLYLTLQDVDKKLRDLLRTNYTTIAQ